MFPQKSNLEQNQKQTVKFISSDPKTNWTWWQDEISYLFIPAERITEVRLVPATDGSINVHARINLQDRFEYKLIENRKTLAAAKKLAEEFVKKIQMKEAIETDNIETNGLKALEILMETLGNPEK
jgi:hypothetical protein